jgi:hypothetical protein
LISLIVVAGPGFMPIQLSAAGASKKPIRLTREELRGYLRAEAKLMERPSISLDDFEAKVTGGPRQYYSADDVQNYLASYKAAVTGGTVVDVKNSGYQGPKTFPWLRLRRSYKDILTGEDPSQGDDGAKKFDDLQGALFSYNGNLIGHTETWSAEMALLAPFSWATGFAPVERDGLHLARYGVVPSFSLHRITTNGDPKGEIDQKTYRVGVFARWESGYKQLNAITVRGFASYANDNLHDVSVPAGEFEIEPFSDLFDKLKIGYRTILWAKDDPEHIHDTAILAYQFRAILHGEYGSRQSEGPAFTGQEYDFFRVGPELQLDLKPLFLSSLSIGLRYHYLPALSGLNSHDSLFAADAEWAILKDAEEQRRLTLKISYLNGGLDLTQEEAHTLLIGFGATF